MSVINAGRVLQELLQISSLVHEVKRSQALLERRHFAMETIITYNLQRHHLVEKLLSVVIWNCCHDGLQDGLRHVFQNRKQVYSRLHKQHMRWRAASNRELSRPGGARDAHATSVHIDRDTVPGPGGRGGGVVDQHSTLFLSFSGWKIAAMSSAHTTAAMRNEKPSMLSLATMTEDTHANTRCSTTMTDAPSTSSCGTLTMEVPTKAMESSGTMTEAPSASGCGTMTEMRGGRIAPHLMDELSNLLVRRNASERAIQHRLRLECSFLKWTRFCKERSRIRECERAREAAEESTRCIEEMQRQQRNHMTAGKALWAWTTHLDSRKRIYYDAMERRRRRALHAARVSFSGWRTRVSERRSALRHTERTQRARDWQHLRMAFATWKSDVDFRLELSRVLLAIRALKAWKGCLASNSTRNQCVEVLHRLRDARRCASGMASVLAAWTRRTRESRCRKNAQLQTRLRRWRYFARSQSKARAMLDILYFVAPRVHPRRMRATLLCATDYALSAIEAETLGVREPDQSVSLDPYGEKLGLEAMLLMSTALDRWRECALLDKHTTRAAQSVFRRQQMLCGRRRSLIRSFASWKVHFSTVRRQEHMSDTISQLAAERDKAIEDMHDVVVSVDTLNWKIEHPSSRISLT